MERRCELRVHLGEARGLHIRSSSEAGLPSSFQGYQIGSGARQGLQKFLGKLGSRDCLKTCLDQNRQVRRKPRARSGNLLPSFDPSIDDAREYAEKVRFIHAVCPAKDKGMLAPRLAMLCRGTAWAQVRTLGGAALTDAEKGVEALLKALSVWEETAELQTFDKVEKALFRTTQKADESTMSFINRLEVSFHDIRDLKLGQIQAFIMLRQSVLTAEDKRKVLVLSNGELQPEKINKAMRSLSTKILSGSNEAKKKVYPVNYVDDGDGEPEEVHFTVDSDEAILESFLQEGDEDALVVQQWEDALLDTLQSDGEMASCLNTYLDARKKLNDKAKNRGFWPSSSSTSFTSKGKGKGRFSSKGGTGFRFRKPLAQRILESECRRCGKRGHWKAECPLRSSEHGASSRPDGSLPVAFTMSGMPYSTDLLESLPEGTQLFQDSFCWCFCAEACESRADPKTQTLIDPNGLTTRIQESFLRCKQQLLNRIELTNPLSVDRKAVPSVLRPTEGADTFQIACFASHGTCGVVDLGASQNVMGTIHLSAFLDQLGPKVRSRVRKGPCQLTFRFGNSATVSSQQALYLPLGSFWIRIALVPGSTPFLLSNALFRSLGAVIDTEEHSVWFRKLQCQVKLTLSERNLFLLDLAHLMQLTQAPSAESQVECLIARETAAQTSEHVADAQSEALPPRVPLCSVMPNPTDVMKSSSTLPQQPFDESSSHSPACVTVPINANHVEIPAGSRQPDQAFVAGATLQENPRCEDRSGDDGRLSPTDVRTDGAANCQLWQDNSRPLVPRRDRERNVVVQMGGGSSPHFPSNRTSNVPHVHGALHGPGGRDGTSALEDRPSGPRLVQTLGDGSLGHDRGEFGDGRDRQRSDFPGGRHAVPHDPHGECSGAARSSAEQANSLPILSHSVCDTVTVEVLQTAVDQILVETEPQLMLEAEDVIGEAFPYEVPANWVEQEFLQTLVRQGFFQKPHGSSDQQNRILELHVGPKILISTEVSKAQGTVSHLSLSDLQLKTWNGRHHLFSKIAEFRPKHIWFSNGSETWSDADFSAIANMLAAALFRHQMCQGAHFHLCMARPVEDRKLDVMLEEIFANTRPAMYGFHSQTHSSTPQFTVPYQVWTSSLLIFSAVDCRHHVNLGGTHVTISNPTSVVRHTFGRKVCKGFKFGFKESEEPLLVSSERTTSSASAQSPLQSMLKRRRLTYKQTVGDPHATAEMSDEHRVAQCKKAFEMLQQDNLPRGKVALTDGPVWRLLQNTFPEVKLECIEVSRNTSRKRMPVVQLLPGQAPWRRTCFLHKGLQDVMLDPTWEAWESLSKRQITRPTEPASLMITMFGTRVKDSSLQFPDIRPLRTQVGLRSQAVNHPSSQSDPAADVAADPLTDHPSPSDSKFDALTPEQQQWLLQVHKNLGHPDAKKMSVLLKQQGVDAQLVNAVSGLRCPTCVAHQLPKLARPSSIHMDRDFNDRVPSGGGALLQPGAVARESTWYKFLPAGGTGGCSPLVPPSCLGPGR